MPINGTGQGQSKHTPVKQQALRYFLTVHAGVVLGIMQKHAWADKRYYYIDTNAGTGRNHDGSDASVLIAQDVITTMGHYLRGMAIEIESDAVFLLREALGHRHAFTIFHGDNDKILRPSMLAYSSTGVRYGLVYCDPNGVDDLPLTALVDFFDPTVAKTRRLDVLINIGANHIKRCRGAGLLKYSLTGIMQVINKDYWYIREGYWHDQWTFLFGTNWDRWPTLNLRVDGVALKGLASLGMHRIDTLRGRELVEELDLSYKERQKKSLMLPIVPIENISSIRNSLLCEPKS